MLVQGVAYNAVKNVLYVADTENHALRCVAQFQHLVVPQSLLDASLVRAASCKESLL